VEDVDALGRRVRVGYEGPWKLVSTASPKGTTTELYDLAHDPAEFRPLHDTTAAPALRAALVAFENDVRPVNNALAPVVDPEREVKLRELGYLQ
jgi:hypothetical protein